MSNLKGILKLVNTETLVIKLEDIIEFQQGPISASVTLTTKDVLPLRVNGQLVMNPSTEILPTEELEIDIANYVNVDSAILTLSLDEIVDKDTSINLNVSCGSVFNFPVYVTRNVLNGVKTYDKQSQMIASNMESFMLLRTNPKLTGNVKLVVDEDYNLFLDTFKISSNSILNKQEYRHQPISADGNYPYDVYRIFKFLPATEMYGIYPDSYDPHISYHKMDDQIRNIYEYGAEYNTDKLYSQNMKILAPLYIGKHLPTYFAIWRSDRLITNDNTVSNTTVFKQLLKDASCIKIFDLRRSTTIGKYLNNYQETISKYLAGTCALQFIEQDNDKNSVDHRQGQNTWKGIAYDKGILTDRNETTYFATKTLEGNAPQENFDMFLLNGFSRNNLLYPNIINLEFMFNDEDVEDFSMYNYFGLYLTENDFLTFNQVLKSEHGVNYKLNYYDTSNNIVNINTTCIDVVEDESYTDRIFFASTPRSVANLNNIDDLNLFVKNNVVNQTYENLVHINGQKVKFDENIKSFLTFDFTKQIKYGEHFKIVVPKYKYGENQTKGIVFEIIASNDERLKDTNGYINPYVQTNTTVRPIDNKVVNVEIYRLNFYTQDINDNSILAPLSEQIKRISNAIEKFDSIIKVMSFGKESLSIVSSENNVYMQHIMAIEDEEKPNDTLRYFNYNNIQPTEEYKYDPDVYDMNHMVFANNGLEETLDRYANIVKFVNIDDIKDKFIYEIDKDIYEETNKVPYPLVYTEYGYFPLTQFNSNNGDLCFETYPSEFKRNGENWISIISPFDVEKSIICSPFEVEYLNEKINICSPLSLNVALMGINDIKDLDVYVNDKKTEEHYTLATATFKANEVVNLDNTDSRIKRFVTYTVISGSISQIPSGSISSFTILTDKIVYSNINSSEPEEITLENNQLTFNEDTEIMLTSTSQLDIYNYTINYPVLNEDNYYIDSVNKDKSNLSIPLVPMINFQWKSNGIYFDTESILDVDKLMSDYEIEGNFIECKYTPGNSNQYVTNSLSDTVIYDNEKITLYDYILKTGSIKKYLCANNKIETAIGYYNPYVQTLEFIFYGIKFILKLASNEFTNEIKINEFNNYEVFIVNDFNNSDTNEIIISKKEEFILIINHTYKSSYYYGNSNIKMYKDNLLQDVTYDWYKTSFNYDILRTAEINDKIYVKKSKPYIISDIENCKSIVELDLDKYDGDFDGFNEKPNYTYFNIDSSTKYFDYYDIYNSSNNLQSNLVESELEIISGFDNIAQKYIGVAQDFRQKNTYVIKSNNTSESEQIALSYSEKIENYINSFNNSEYDVYIIENESNEMPTPIHIGEIYKPLNIEIIKPNKVKYNNGLFDPNFVNIFDFSINDPISERIGIDTLYGNTLLNSINSIKNYYSNKVLSEQSVYTYNYFAEEFRSPFSTNWDNNIYRTYTSDNTYQYLPGYSIGIDDKMFFGSKVLNLHNTFIELNKWNYENNVNIAKYNISKQNEHSKPKKILEIQLNLTKTFYDYCMNLEEFTNNWKTIKNNINTKVYINNYINNVLYNFYNFKGNFDIELYEQYTEKLSDSKASVHFAIEKEKIDMNEATLSKNYKTEFKDVNNEVILTITIDDYENYIYYPIVKINKI